MADYERPVTKNNLDLFLGVCPIIGVLLRTLLSILVF